MGFVLQITFAWIGNDGDMFIDLIAVTFGKGFFYNRVDDFWLGGAPGFRNHADADFLLGVLDNGH